MHRRYEDKLMAQWDKLNGPLLSNSRDVMKEIVKVIPSDKVNTYIEWVTKRFLSGELDLTDSMVSDEVRDTLLVHMKAAQSNKSIADPNKFNTFEEMYEKLSSERENHTEDQNHEREKDEVLETKGRKDSGAELEVWIKDKLYRINSAKAARAMGVDRWCVSNRREDGAYNTAHCEDHTNNWNDPFFIADLDFGKYAIFPGAYGRGEFRDEMNNGLDSHNIQEIFRDEPEVYSMIEPYIDEENSAWHPYVDNPKIAYKVLDDNVWLSDEDRQRYVDVVSGSAEYSLKYATDLGGRFKQGESSMRQDSDVWEEYLHLMDEQGVTDDIEGDLQNAYHPNPQMDLKFSESFKKWSSELMIHT